MRITIYNPKKQKVGEIDVENKTYYTDRDAAKGQVFHFYGNGIAIGTDILKDLLKNNIRFIVVTLVNFEVHSFFLVTTLNYFLQNSDAFNYDKRNEYGENYTGYGEQRRMQMNMWRRAYTWDDVKKIKFEEQLTLV